MDPIIPVIPPRPAEPGSRWLSDWSWRDFLELGPLDTAPRTARGLIREQLPRWGLGHFQETVELVATEMITNAVEATWTHIRDPRLPPVRLWLLGSEARAAVLVWDDVPLEPVERGADVYEESGRGLLIVKALAEWCFWFPAAPFTGKVTMAIIGQKQIEGEAVLLATRCSCGFGRLGDEEVSDHLLAVFEPAGSVGTDGLVHLEMAALSCGCGFRAGSAGELDRHFIAVFTPADAVGRDGRKHEAL